MLFKDGIKSYSALGKNNTADHKHIFLELLPLLSYLATVDVFNCCLPKEEENVIFICHGTHKIWSWNTNQHISEK